MADNRIIPENGKPFSPYRRFFSVMVPVQLLAYPDISAGAKLLLARLYLYAGKKEYCNPSLATLAGELGASIDTIDRWLGELVKEGFIRRERKARAVAVCRLLFHPCLGPSLRSDDSARMPNHVPLDDSAELPNHGGAMTPQICGDDSAEMRSSDSAELRNAYKEEKKFFEKNQLRDSSSSSSSAVTVEKTRKMSALWIPTPEELEQARPLFQGLVHGRDLYTKNPHGQPPHRHDVKRWCAGFEELGELVLYVRDHEDRKTQIRSYSYFDGDIREHWPIRRESVIQDAQAAQEKPKSEGNDGYWRDFPFDEIYGPEPTQAPKPPFCEQCQNEGFRLVGHYTLGTPTWCTCALAVQLKQANPNRVAEELTLIQRLRSEWSCKAAAGNKYAMEICREAGIDVRTKEAATTL